MRNLFNATKFYPQSDIPASLAVFFVAVPLCLGIAHASNAPLISGLITGIIGGIVVGFLSKSSLSVSGPAAGLTAVMIAGIEDLGSFEALLVATILAGALQIILGLIRAGSVSNYFPNSVIKGMLAAIGLILIMKQFPHLIGYDVEMMGVTEFALTEADLSNPSYHETNTFTTLIHAISNINPGIFFLGVGSFIFLYVWEKKFHQKFKAVPGSIIVVVLATGVSILYPYLDPSLALSSDHLVNLPSINSLESFMSEVPRPDWSFIGNRDVQFLALTIALVASVETLLSVNAIDKLDPEKRSTPTNRELIAQGAGNALAGFLGGLPMTSVIIRSSVNLTVGARSKLSTILHGFWLLAGVVFLSKIINTIPLAALAAILVYTGYKLASPRYFKEQYKLGYDQIIPYVVTIVAILFTDLLVGVLIGFVTAAFFIVQKTYQAPAFTLVDNGLRKRIILGENVHFLHKSKIVNLLKDVTPDSILEIDGSKTLFLDHDIEATINEFAAGAASKNIRIVFGGIKKIHGNKEEQEKKMAETYEKLLENNKKWVQEKLGEDSGFFEKQSKGQAPRYLFIGCSDSRVPAEKITQTEPGEMFVHRNIANMVISTDLNAVSVIQYAVEVLNVQHIIVCGHYGCGGVKAAMEDKEMGLIDKWLGNIKDVYRLHQDELEKIENYDERYNKLIELNVEEQVLNLMKIPFIQKNRSQYDRPQIHGWVYDLRSGLINDLQVNVKEKFQELDKIYKVY